MTGDAQDFCNAVGLEVEGSKRKIVCQQYQGFFFFSLSKWKHRDMLRKKKKQNLPAKKNGWEQKI